MKSDHFIIIWKHFRQSSDLGQHLNADKDFSLPYFLAGEEKVAFEQKKAVSLTPVHLVKGLLVGYFDQPPGTDTRFAKQHAKTIITEQIANFKMDSLEHLILDVSNYLRVNHGSQVSLQSLMAGVELLNDSNYLKYDCAIDLIQCIDDELLDDRLAAVQQLKILLSKIDLKTLNTELVPDYRKMIEIANEF